MLFNQVKDAINKIDTIDKDIECIEKTIEKTIKEDIFLCFGRMGKSWDIYNNSKNVFNSYIDERIKKLAKQYIIDKMKELVADLKNKKDILLKDNGLYE